MSEALWAAGGVVGSAPITSAMSSLPLLEGDGVALDDALRRARRRTDWRVWERLTRRRTTKHRRATTSEDDLAAVALWFIGAVALIGAYATFAETAALVLTAAAIGSFAVTLSVFTLLYLRSVFRGRRTAALLLFTVTYDLVGVVVSCWILDPPMHGRLPEALVAIRAHGLLGVMPYVGELGAQLVGALLSFALLLSCFAVSVTTMAAVFIELGAVGSRLLWPLLFWAGRWATGRGAGVAFAILAVLALAFSGGFYFEFIGWLTSLSS